MQVLSCSEVLYGDCSNKTSSSRDLGFDKESSQRQQSANDGVTGASKTMERPQTERQVDALPPPPASGSHCNGASRDRMLLESQQLVCESRGYEDDDDNDDEANIAGTREAGPSFVKSSSWLEGDESIALWAMWRGKWHAGIRCPTADWPLSSLKAKPTHQDRNGYFVIFFPHAGIHSWADMPHLLPIHESPHPIAYKSHRIGVEMVKDLTVARSFIIQKLAIAMLNAVEQFHTEALIVTARDAAVWKEFAVESSRCNGYTDLGRMLLKLQNMISSRYINAEWLLSSFNLWVRRCQNSNTAESIEMLKEELFNSIRWNEIQSLKEAQLQPTLGSEWKTWKHEIMKLFPMANLMTGSGDLQQQSSDGSLSTSPQVSMKRPKLEVRRAESHAFVVENRGSDQSGTVEIDSAFFNNRDIANPLPTDLPVDMADKWNEIVVEPENGTVRQANGVEMTPVHQVGSSTKALDSGNKNRQCTAYIESKGRQCVRWANDGDVYCCVHLSSRFSGSSAKSEGNLFNDTPMCDGTTVLGTKCKHRSLPGISFCKKHRPKTEMQISNFVENPLKRKYEENIPSLQTTHGKELALVGDAALEVDPIMVQNTAFQGPIYLGEKPKLLAIEHKSTEVSNCIGSCLRDNNDPCPESPKRHGLYCEKHLPSWLKRARNGKSRIVSKEVFVELLRDCHVREQKVQLHQACELFYRLFKSILSLRNQVPKEVQFQWALSEASKDIGVGDFFMKLVTSEKERLVKVWGFSVGDDTRVLTPAREEPAQVSNVVDVSQDDDKSIKCKVCSEVFLDDQSLGNHWRDNHKKEAQWLFRGYACAICLDSFTNKKVLESHVQERHHVQFVEQCMLLQCIPCSGHFGNAEELWLHVLSVHPDDFRLSKEAPALPPVAVESPPKPELCSLTPAESNTDKLSGSRRFVCKLCGLRFDLLPDLGRHHQAAHMGPSLISSRPAKKGVRYYAYRMKSGRLSRPKFKKTAAAASYRIRNRAADNIKKRIQASKVLSTGGLSVVQPRLPEAPSISMLDESRCSSVAQILFSEIQKTKSRPDNTDILSIARSVCCKINLKASLEAKYGTLPERLYLKAAKICAEHNILVTWHQDGFICPKGCKALKDPHLYSPLKTLPKVIVSHASVRSFEPVDEKYQMDEGHYVLDLADLGQKSLQNFHVLCDDISYGRESVRVACVADHGLSISDSICTGGSDGQSNTNMPWESFTYIAKPLIDQSVSLDAPSSKMGCVCRQAICCPETCDHVYLFDCDYDDARDIYGKPMRGRFPYDERSRIILEEGYLVYECNQMCSCPRTCTNRVLQNGVRVKLEVFKTEEKGWAVRAGEAIMRGTFICEHVGEVLDEQEADVRRKRYGKEGCGYLFEMDAHVNDMSRLIEGQSRYIIDATKYGNVSRFINHSCLPNLLSHQVLVESMDCQGSHIGLYANRDISLGEELTYDYRCSFVPGEGFACQCGASTCRGRLH